jgi:hypothetical protein
MSKKRDGERESPPLWRETPWLGVITAASCLLYVSILSLCYVYSIPYIHHAGKQAPVRTCCNRCSALGLSGACPRNTPPTKPKQAMPHGTCIQDPTMSRTQVFTNCCFNWSAFIKSQFKKVNVN